MSVTSGVTPAQVKLLLAAYRRPGLTLVEYLEASDGGLSYTSLRRHASRLRAMGLLAPTAQTQNVPLRLAPGWRTKLLDAIRREEGEKNWPRWGILRALRALAVVADTAEENTEVWGCEVSVEAFQKSAEGLGWDDIGASIIARLRRHLKKLGIGYAWDALVLTPAGHAQAQALDKADQQIARLADT